MLDHYRYDILKKLLHDTTQTVSDDHLLEIVNVAHGFVGADLVSLCSRATLDAYQNKQKELQFDNFKSALRHIKPSAMREVQIEVRNFYGFVSFYYMFIFKGAQCSLVRYRWIRKLEISSSSMCGMAYKTCR